MGFIVWVIGKLLCFKCGFASLSPSYLDKGEFNFSIRNQFFNQRRVRQPASSHYISQFYSAIVFYTLEDGVFHPLLDQVKLMPS